MLTFWNLLKEKLVPQQAHRCEILGRPQLSLSCEGRGLRCESCGQEWMAAVTGEVKLPWCPSPSTQVGVCFYSATPSLTWKHTMRAVPLSLKISPLKRNTFPGAIALEFSICVLLST